MITLTCENLHEFSNKLKFRWWDYALGKLKHFWSQISRDTVSFRAMGLFQSWCFKMSLSGYIITTKYVHTSWQSSSWTAHCNKNPIYVFPEKELPCLSTNFHIHVSVSVYSQDRSVHIFSYSRKGRPIVGIYKSLTDTWIWKSGLRPRTRNSFSKNICLEFSVVCLCSAETIWALST